MGIANRPVRESAKRGARVVALVLVREVIHARGKLDDPADAEALHDFRVALRRLRTWVRAFRPALRDTVQGKLERRARRIARATGASRDLEVRIEWVTKVRRSMRGDERRGATWLLKRLRADKIARDADLRERIDDKFDATMRRLEKAVSRYEARVEGEPTYDEVTRDILTRHVETLGAAMAALGGSSDPEQIHEARIAAKRLRYVLECLAMSEPDRSRAVSVLKDLQDHLGDLHDAQMFCRDLETITAEALRDEQPADRAWAGNGKRVGGTRFDPVPGLRALLARVRHREDAAFKLVGPAWKAAGAVLSGVTDPRPGAANGIQPAAEMETRVRTSSG